MTVWPGNPFPLGATYDGSGTNFSLFSEVAQRVDLCLFDEDGKEEKIPLTERTGYCWHAYLPEVGPGQRYGYRLDGPWNPAEGQRCNPVKLLLDPYAKAFDGEVKWDEAVFPYRFHDGPESRNDTDSARFMPKAIVHQPHFDWAGDRRLQLPFHETIIYETHVRGFTNLNHEIPTEIRGTYAGLAHPVSVDYLKQLRITAVELMPIHQFVHDKLLLDRGLRNYWGYNSIGYFAPHNGYAADKRPGGVVGEFKHMVKTFHQAGIEVILDVVYNHTAEGNHLGPVLSFKGIDNAYYYRLMPDRRYYMDYTGTGNSLNMRNVHVLQLIMDSLRYWVLEMHVDGFRFDLAATLARELHDVDRLSTFLDIVHQDPIVSQVKLIAEPWDLGDGGYQVGNFPTVWSEWNGKYRDCVRDFWRGQQSLGEFATRFTGSSDLYENTTRLPFASINFVTAHDGFTLNDLVSYNGKHNEANGEENRDGENNNRSWNCGAEGDTQDEQVLKFRAQQKRNFLVTLLLSQGVPMLLGGDEFGRTQHGNNNAYCQDNEISWYDWEHIDRGLLAFTRNLVRYRLRHPVFRRRRWFQGKSIVGDQDIAWFAPGGEPMSAERWKDGSTQSLMVLLNGQNIPNPNTKGPPVKDDNFLILLNAHHEAVEFKLPAQEWGLRWALILNTATNGFAEEQKLFEAGQTVENPGHSLLILCEERAKEGATGSIQLEVP